MLRTRVCVAIALFGLVMPASALAHRPASKTERASILVAAVHQGELSSRQAVCQTVTVSTVNQDYAALAWPAKLSQSCAQVAGNGVIIEHRARSGWLLAAAGSSFECPVKAVPTKVARDLGVCP